MNDFETKYVAKNYFANNAYQWMKLRFAEDPKFKEAVISSIYFDTPSIFHMHEKFESDHIKSKFRIRWYEDMKTGKPSDVCFFEFKHKVGENRFKKRIKNKNIFSDLDLDSPEFINCLDELRLYNSTILDNIFPVFQLSYTRSRFVIPGTEIRLCIDRDIHIRKINKNIMKKDFKPMNLSHCVFELKGETAVLPESLERIENFGFHKNSFSKYEQCYRELIE